MADIRLAKKRKKKNMLTNITCNLNDGKCAKVQGLGGKNQNQSIWKIIRGVTL